MPKSLKEMNKQMKINMNEASSISTKCKRKLMTLVEEYFAVDLPEDNYLNIDIEILENGNIKMRDKEYETKIPISSKEELEKRFETFQKEVDLLLDRNEISFETKTQRAERNNLIWLLFLTFAGIVIMGNAIYQIVMGNLFGILWLAIIVGYYIVPTTGTSLRNRYVRAYRYLKSLIYKKKK
ncbi:MAG: hypothetical protein J6X28_00435 [Bacilli bacterium]|nr:hypothetical protein [Bacilli bacterium]